MDLIKLISFCTAKGTINKMKKKLRMEENIASNVTNKSLIAKICKQPVQLNNKK